MSVEIGTVEVLRERIYAGPDGGDVFVEPGVYPLRLEDGGIIRWHMRGRVSTRTPGRFEDLGDGLFAVRDPFDSPRGELVELPSRAYTRAQFREFLSTEPVVAEGHPEQRLRVRVLVEP